MVWALDLDGVVWLAGDPIAGAAEAVTRLRAANQVPVFVTNNSGPTIAQYIERLHRAGIEARADEIVTSAQAAASLIGPGSRVAALGGPGVTEALVARGAMVVPAADEPEAVVVGRSVELNYDELAITADALRAGARFVATNTDATFPTPTGLVPGAGALIAFLQVASGVTPEVAGKPNRAVADLIHQRFGAVAVGVGDRADTDGEFARALGARFALVLTGVTRRTDLPVTPAPDLVAENLLAAVVQELG